MVYRVIQWATGGIGQEFLRQALDNPDLELVGVKVYSDAKHGQDAGEFVGRGPTGVRASKNIEDLLEIEADVVLHAPLNADMNEMDSDVIRLLESGKNVISVSGYYGPQSRGAEVYARLDAAAKKGGVTLHGSGISPGFVFDRIAPTITSMCVELDHLKLKEAADASVVAGPEIVFGAIGIGQPVEEINESRPFTKYFLDFSAETVAGLGQTLHLDFDRVDRGVTAWPATRDLEIAAGMVAKGTTAATGYWFSGIVDGREKLRLEVDWFVERGLDGILDPTENVGWLMEIEGKPSGRVRFDLMSSLREPGLYEPMYYATMSTSVRCIPDVVAAEPGILIGPVFAPYAPRLDYRSVASTPK